ncbi:uncharacterized protein ACMZJ9_018931 [Mantella aurantiaca]
MSRMSAAMGLMIPCTLLLLISGAVFSYQIENGILGRSVHFYESIPIQVDPIIQWTFKNGIIAQRFPNGPPVCNIERCQLFENGTLRLDNLTFADEGNYTITAQYPNVTLIKQFTYGLKVYNILNAPVLTRNDTSNSLIGGSIVSLHCNASGQTVTTYSFNHEGKNICSEPHVTCRDSYLYFQPITVSDNGRYNCTIQNPVSSNTSNTLQLTVIDRVSEVNLTSNKSGIVWPGLDSVSLTCSARGTNVTYSWNLQGSPLVPGPQYSFMENNTVLTISPVSDKENGTFTCTASNQISTETSNGIKLILGSKVSAVMLTSNTSGSLIWAGEDSVSLNCSADGSNVTFTWKLNGKLLPHDPRYHLSKFDSPPHSNLLISPVSRNDYGPFTCEASNPISNETSTALNLNLACQMSGPWLADAHALLELVKSEVSGGDDHSTLYESSAEMDLTYHYPSNGVEEAVQECEQSLERKLGFSPNIHSYVEMPVWKMTAVHRIPEKMVSGNKRKWQMKLIRKKEKTSPVEDHLLIKSDVQESDFESRSRGHVHKRCEDSENVEENLEHESCRSPENGISCSAIPIGSDVELRCSWPGGQPEANVSLIFDGKTEAGTSNVFSNVTNVFQGSNLTCHGDQLGRTSQCTYIFAPPMAPGHKNNTITEAKVGETVVLQVILEPGLPGEFTWNHLKAGSSPIQISRKGFVESNSSSSILRISNVTVADAGEYICIAKNIIGNQSFLFTVDVAVAVTMAKKGLDGGAIAGIVIGVLAAVTLIGILIFFIVKKKKRSGNNKRISEPEEDQGTTVQYATVQKKNGGVADTSLENDQLEDKDDVKYAVIKFPNNNSNQATVPPPVETEYSTVKTSIRQ